MSIKNKFFFILFFLFCVFLLTPLVYAQTSDVCRAFLDEAALQKEAMEYGQAIRILERASACNDPSVQQYRARLYYLNGNSLKALEILEAMTLQDWSVFLYLGLVNEDLGKKNAAVSNYMKSLSLRKTSITLYRLGKIYYHNKSYKKAAYFFNETIAFDSSIRLANYYLADCFAKLGDYEQAYKYAARGVNFYPQSQEVKQQLGEVKSKLGESFFADIKNIIEDARRMVKLMFYISEKDVPLVRVGIADNLEEVSFRFGADFTASDGKKIFYGKKDKYYTVIRKNNNLFLRDYEKKVIYEKFKKQLEIKAQNYPFYLLDVVYGKGNFWHKKIDRAYRGELKITINNGMALINTLSMEEYLYGVLPAEIPASGDMNALRAQAVAARTLVYKNMNQRHKNDGFDVCADVHCQVYQGLSVENPRTNQAVKDTRGEILMYDKAPITSIYHANCGGCLRADVFGNLAYCTTKFDSEKDFYKMQAYEQEMWLMGMPDAFCTRTDKAGFRWQRLYDAEDFMQVFGWSLSEIKTIVPLEKGEGSQYKTIRLTNDSSSVELKGDVKIRDYFEKLRSSMFKVEIKFSADKKAQMLFFWGGGFGHGVGLCQAGAEKMAQQGHTYREILKHYYPKAGLTKLY
ncbi:MAG: SpoIID/LytB domain-containing protein [Candidatus Omnitrophota bacterium]